MKLEPVGEDGTHFGKVIRVQPNGNRAAATSTLENPTSVTIGRDGAAYVSNRGVHAWIGEVLRIPIL